MSLTFGMHVVRLYIAHMSTFERARTRTQVVVVRAYVWRELVRRPFSRVRPIAAPFVAIPSVAGASQIFFLLSRKKQSGPAQFGFSVAF